MSILRGLLFGAGLISLALAIIGVFLPILPTTPFLILTASCFYKSSPAAHRWIISNRFFGPYIKNYLQYKAISIKSKIIAILLMWVVISVSTIFIIKLLWLRLALLGVALVVTAHIIRIKTLTKEMLDENGTKT